MSLATQCPHCHTTFKVAPDQLKLQAGLVRCGICQQVFNGSEHVVDTDTPARTSPPDDELTQPLSEAVVSESTNAAAELLADIETNDGALLQTQDIPALAIADCGSAEEVIILNSRLNDEEFKIDTPAKGMETTEATEATASTIPDNQTDADAAQVSHDSEPQDEVVTRDANKEKNKEEHTDEIEQLTFIRQAKNKKSVRWILITGTLILLLALVGQTTYLFRDLIAATYPPGKKTLVTLCQYARCQIQLPAQLNELSYEADELHTLPHENTFEFSLLMRNHSALTQAWPHIELALQNTQNHAENKQTVLRRVFTPADYLSNHHDISYGFPAHQEQVVKLFFVVDKVKASDYSVAIFYP